MSADPVPTPGPPTAGHPAAGRRPARPSDGETKAPLGLTVRVFIYLVAVHIIVGFFFWVFHMAGAK